MNAVMSRSSRGARALHTACTRRRTNSFDAGALSGLDLRIGRLLSLKRLTELEGESEASIIEVPKSLFGYGFSRVYYILQMFRIQVVDDCRRILAKFLCANFPLDQLILHIIALVL